MANLNLVLTWKVHPTSAQLVYIISRMFIIEYVGVLTKFDFRIPFNAESICKVIFIANEI